MKQTNALKLTFLAVSTTALGVGCASSGYARYDNDRPGTGMSAYAPGAGVSANADTSGAGFSAGAGPASVSAGASSTDTGVSVGADTRNDRDLDMRTHHAYRSDRDLSYRDRTDRNLRMETREEGPARVTVSALSFTPETRANWVNKFPFYDPRWELSTIETYTFAVPDRTLSEAERTDLPQFSVNLPPGSVFVESAGGAGEVRTGRIIQHSPVPMR